MERNAQHALRAGSTTALHPFSRYAGARGSNVTAGAHIWRVGFSWQLIAIILLRGHATRMTLRALHRLLV